MKKADPAEAQVVDDGEYKERLHQLQIELVKLQRHNIAKDRKMLVILEGRDAAGKDGTIKRLSEHLSPRETRIVALSKPTDREKTAWYFQRWVPHLPAADEFVLFNRSWYNRAGVERVMGFCTEDELREFYETVGFFEQMLMRSGVVLFKYYMDISRDEQKKRMKERKRDPLKQWKISPIDAVANKLWKEYSEARNDMLAHTHSPASPWTIVKADHKKTARINLISDLLCRLDYEGKNEKAIRPNPSIVFTYDPAYVANGLIAPPDMEIEIKLTAYPGDLPAVLRAVGDVASVVEPPAAKRLESRYYDTPCRTLWAKGMTLRVRQTGGKFVQTVKTEGDGPFSRGEWEKPVASFAPELDGHAEGLGEAFVTEVDRNKLVARFPAWRSDPSRIELAIDTGVIRAHEREMPVNEVELELIDGDAADLFDLGARLAELVPLQLSVDAKSARGFRLAADIPPGSVKADKLEFPDDVSLEDGMRESLRACIRQWLANQASALDGRDPEGVHQMRVALRRLRSAINFFRDFIPDPPFAEFRDQSKWAAGALGPARDWDVFLLETLPPVMMLWPEHRGLRALHDGAATMRESGYAEARVAMSSPAYTVFALRLAGWIERRGWRAGLSRDEFEAMQRPMTEHASDLLDRLYHRAMDVGDDFDALDPEAKHRVRIALKKLRYASEFFRSLYRRKDVKKFRDALTEMLELLGKLNDLTVAKSLCARLMETGGDEETVATGTATVITFHEQRGHVSDKALSGAWDDLRGAEPFWRD